VAYKGNVPAGTLVKEEAQALFRIAEEALRNVERHAGATAVTVRLRAPDSENGLTLIIADDGIGLDPKTPHPGHYALAGLREQTPLIGAILTIESAPQQGTKIAVAMPPARADRADRARAPLVE
jgi:signal transduction histidine kinase